MDTKMLMRIYARAGGYGTDNPPYLRAPSKQAEKLNAYAAERARADRKIAELRLHHKAATRH